MSRNLFYTSPFWRSLRKAALKRDRYRCTVPGCRSTHRLTVNHKQPRPRGVMKPTPLDVLDNLETLCMTHDNQIKENAAGVRRSGGVLVARGVDINGRPTDPAHPWHRL